jgi:hypothetical protein
MQGERPPVTEPPVQRPPEKDPPRKDLPRKEPPIPKPPIEDPPKQSPAEEPPPENPPIEHPRTYAGVDVCGTHIAGLRGRARSVRQDPSNWIWNISLLAAVTFLASAGRSLLALPSPFERKNPA